jgi:pilus assembly protein CpaB
MTILLLALLISGGATYFVYRGVSNRANPAPAAKVVMAARQLEIGTLIKDSDLTMGAWEGAVPASMATRKESILGRGVTSAIYASEPVMEDRLAAPGAGGGLAATIPPGMRAAAVRVNDIVGVAGFVLPGMRVDVLISGVPPGAQTPGGPKVKTLLQNIQVLSAGQNYQKDSEGKPVLVPVVNLLVNPEQAEILSLASNETHIQLVLRNPLDTESAKPPGAALASLYGEPKAALPKPAAAKPVRTVTAVAIQATPKPVPPVALPPYQIEIFNGAQRTEAKFARQPEEKQ